MVGGETFLTCGMVAALTVAITASRWVHVDATDTIASGERRRDQRPQMLQLRTPSVGESLGDAKVIRPEM